MMSDTLPQQTEKEFQQAVIDYAHRMGWSVYHTYDSRRSAPGFPDLVLCRGRVVFAELKRAGGRLSVTQRAWLDDLRRADQEVYVWYPDDWPDIESVLT